MIRKKIILVVTMSILILSGIVALLGNHSRAEQYEFKEKLEEITKGENGDIVIKGNKELNSSRIHTVLEDGKYIYEMTSEDGLVGLKLKNNISEKYKIKGILASNDAENIASQYINKYFPGKEFSYVLKKNIKKSDENFEIYMLDYNEVASNGIGTGDSIMVWINMDGDVTNLSHIKGDTDLALNSKAVISKKEAEKIALDKVYQEIDGAYINESDKKYIPNNSSRRDLIPELEINSDLTVSVRMNLISNKNTLVYEVTIAPKDTKAIFPTYYFKINAENGNIEFSDVSS